MIINKDSYLLIDNKLYKVENFASDIFLNPKSSTNIIYLTSLESNKPAAMTFISTIKTIDFNTSQFDNTYILTNNH